MNSRDNIPTEISREQHQMLNVALENKIESGNQQSISQQILSLGTLPADSCKHIFSFLSVKELSQIKRTSKRIKDFADFAIHYDLCGSHPQHLRKDSLAYYLIEGLAQQSLLEDKQAPEEMIQAFFNREFGQYAANLLVNYEALYNEFVNERWYNRNWIDQQQLNYLKKHFYPHVQSSEWINSECRRVWELAQKIQLDYKAVFNDAQETKLDGSKLKPLPVSISSEKYNKLYEFLESTHFFEKLWSDMSFMYSILPKLQCALQNHVWNTFEGQVQVGAAFQAIIDFFKQPRLTRNISYLSFLVIKNLHQRYFCDALLIDNPLLFYHFNKLSVNELISVAKGDGYCTNFLRKLIGKDEIRLRLESCHYRDLACYPESISFVHSRARIILSLPQVTAKLTEKDLRDLLLYFKLNNSFLKIVTENTNLRTKMNNELWFKLVNNEMWSEWDFFIVNNKTVYDSFSPAQLKQLISIKYQYYILLLDNDVFQKISNLFSVAELDNIKKWPWKSIERLKNYDLANMVSNEKIYFSIENGFVKIFLVSWDRVIAHILTAENSKKIIDMWDTNEALNIRQNKELFDKFVFLFLYPSDMEQRINQLYYQVLKSEIAKFLVISDSLSEFPEEKMVLSMPVSVLLDPIEKRKLSTTKDLILPETPKAKLIVKRILSEALSDDLYEHMLSFLSEKDLMQIMCANRKFRILSRLTIHFNRCWDHPQHLQKDSLTFKLIELLAQQAPVEEKFVAEEKIQDYFNERFDQHAANLLIDYERLYFQYFANQWVHGENFTYLKNVYYPHIQSSGWIKTECRSVWELAQKIKSDFEAIFNLGSNSTKSKETILKPLPVSLPIEKYIQLCEFLDRTHFLQRLWSDFTFLSYLLPYFNAAIQNNVIDHFLDNVQVGVVYLPIINFFSQPRLSQNISYLTFLFIQSLKPRFFSNSALVDNPLLFNRLNKISVKELIAINRAIPYDTQFLKQLMDKDEIHERFESCHYVNVTFFGNYKSIIPFKSSIILSLPKVVAKLTDNDLLKFFYSRESRNEYLSLSSKNSILKTRMNGDLWFEVAIDSYSAKVDSFFTKIKAIYDLFSTLQLKILIQKYNYHGLLLDNDIFCKICTMFTIAEINIIRNQLCDSIERLNKYDSIKTKFQNQIFFWVEDAIVKASWSELGQEITHTLTFEDSKKVIDIWGDRETLQKNQNAILFNQLILLFNYSSRIKARVNQLYCYALRVQIARLPTIRDSLSCSNHERSVTAVLSPYFQREKDVSTALARLCSKHEEAKPVLANLSITLPTTPVEEIALPATSVGALSNLVDEKPILANPNPKLAPAEEKSVLRTHTPTHSFMYLQAAILLGSALVISGTAVGIAALFLPYLLTAAIAVLGAALLAFSAYGILHYSQQGFFSSRQNLMSTQYNQPSIQNCQP